MIDVSKVAYNVYAVLQDGTRLNVTPAVTDLGWEEGEGELSARFSFTAANVDYNGNPLSSTIKPNTAIVVTASAGGDEKEVANGKVIEWYPQDSATAKGFSVVCYDDLYNLQKSQDDRYIKTGTGTKSALNAIFSDWGIPAGEYKGPDKPHAKTLFKAEYLGDIITELLDDAEKHGADNYVIRMTGGKVDVLPINANETVYHFDEDDNLTTSGDKISTADLVTRVKVIGLEKKTKKRSVEATLDGKRSMASGSGSIPVVRTTRPHRPSLPRRRPLTKKGSRHENHPERCGPSVYPQGRQNPGCGQNGERLLHRAGSAARRSKPHYDHDC